MASLMDTPSTPSRSCDRLRAKEQRGCRGPLPWMSGDPSLLPDGLRRLQAMGARADDATRQNGCNTRSVNEEFADGAPDDAAPGRSQPHTNHEQGRVLDQLPAQRR